MAPDTTGRPLSNEKLAAPLDEKIDLKHDDVESVDNVDSSSEFGVLENERDIVTHILSVTDDSSLNPWTIRAFIIGIGLSAFGGVLGMKAIQVLLLKLTKSLGS